MSMQIPHVLALVLLGSAIAAAAERGLERGQERGATIPWTTYEAEEQKLTDATVIGPAGQARDKNNALPQTVEMEASGRRAVRLDKVGGFVQLTTKGAANALVVRYSLPDSADGVGLDSQLALFVNNKQVGTLPVTSRYSWRYGSYTFTNTPSDGKPRNFFDEVRIKDLKIAKNDSVKIQRLDAANACVIDLIDLEPIPAPLTAPAQALDVTSADFGADPTGAKDATEAFKKCIAAATAGKPMWIPPGTFLITGDLTVPAGVTIQGAGMWHTTLIGDPAQYNLPNKGGERKRVRLNGAGSNIHVADFAIVGFLNYREDGEANDGFSEFFGTGSTISRIWIEHTKTGAWIANSSGLVIDGCRFRNQIGDGVNLCVGVRESIIQNCTARGTGDDAFAIWPATYTAQTYAPGLNNIRNCTGALTSLGNGVGVYGGEGNTVQNCVFTDVPFGCGILIAGTFPIGPNGFTGTTVVQRCDILRCGGFDSGWNAWRGALTICPQNNDIIGLTIDQVSITDSLAYGIQFTNPGNQKVLSDAVASNITITGYGVGVPKASPEPAYCDGVYAVVSDAKGGIDFQALSIDGVVMTQVPTSGTLIRKPKSEFIMQFVANTTPVSGAGSTKKKADKKAKKSQPEKADKQAPAESAVASGTGWFKGITIKDLTTSTVNGAKIVSLTPGSDGAVVLTYSAGAQYGIHQVECANKLTTADLAGHQGIRLTVTSANFGRLIVLPRDYEANGRAYEASVDIGMADKQTYDIPFSAMAKPGWSQGASFADAAAAIAAGEALDTLTIGWVCNTAGLEGTVIIHRVELY